MVPKTKVVAYGLRSHKYGNNIWLFSCFVYNQFGIIKLQENVINICKKCIVQTFKITLRIDIRFEIRERVHRKLLVFIQNNVSCLYMGMYHQI